MIIKAASRLLSVGTYFTYLLIRAYIAVAVSARTFFLPINELEILMLLE